jgi:predicted DNA-binding transcriptional regulator AlpA
MAKLAVEVNGVRYVTLDKIAERIGRSRQTIWRWRKQGVIPQGNRDRRGRVLFSEAEFETIRKYATTLEAIALSPADDSQLRLFANGGTQ